LRSYGAQKGHIASICEAMVICYFGVKALPGSLCLSADDLDDHFVFPVRRDVERVNQYFQEQLHLLLESIANDQRLDFDGLCQTCPLKGRSVH
jgi:hypothetical protein